MPAADRREWKWRYKWLIAVQCRSIRRRKNGHGWGSQSHINLGRPGMDQDRHLPPTSPKGRSMRGRRGPCVRTRRPRNSPLQPWWAIPGHVSGERSSSLHTPLALVKEIDWLTTPCSAQPPMVTLLEINQCASHIVGRKMEIFVDGGVRRGTDVIKALALGATAVGVGRPCAYSMTGDYGEAGVRRLSSRS